MRVYESVLILYFFLILHIFSLLSLPVFFIVSHNKFFCQGIYKKFSEILIMDEENHEKLIIVSENS